MKENFKPGIIKKLKEGTVENTEYFDFGTAFHKYVLQPALFEKEYSIMERGFPEGKYADAVKILVDTQDIFNEGEEDKTKEWLENAILLAKLEKCSVDSLHKKIWDNDKDKSYLEMFIFLESSKGKKIVTLDDWNTLCKMKQSILNSSYAGDFIYTSTIPTEDVEVFTELNILWEEKGFEGLILDSTLDRVLIKHSKKEIHIFDLKSTAKKVSKFSESIEEYKYPRQGTMYTKAIQFKFAQYVDNGYIIFFHLIGVVPPHIKLIDRLAPRFTLKICVCY